MTKNLRLHGIRKLRDCYFGPFVILEHIGKTVYCLDLSLHAALRVIYNVSLVSLLHDWLSNGVHANVPPIKIDGKAEYKVASIKEHRECNGELLYLTLFVGYHSSENVWLTTAQLEHAPQLL